MNPRFHACLAALALAGPPTHAQPPAITDALVIAPGRQAGRSPVWSDPVEHAWVVGEWTAPTEGDTVTRLNGQTATWTRATFDENGALNDRALRNGYALVTVESDTEQIVMLEAAAHSAVRVNGESRAGDPYNYGFVRVPIKLRAGSNELLFRCARGQLRARLTEAPADLFFLGADDTLPDLVDAHPLGPAGVVVVNAVDEWSTITLTAHQAGASPQKDSVSNSFTLAPLSVRKLPIHLPPPAIVDGSAVPYTLSLSAEGRTVGPTREVNINTRAANQRHDRTFISSIDGSAQYYTVVPPSEPIENPALVLTLHGASVEGRGQAAAYAPKDWAAIVAPTNRRPFGFDWEDWGRIDAIEVLDRAAAELNADPARIYLTGHSMGGHGTWNIGVNFPGRFAAIAPSAGWVSFWSYTGAADFNHASTVESLMRRAVSPSDTLALSENLNHAGVYILHGDADDNVPVAQARTMRTELAGFHRDFSYYEQPGAGHWWGNQCVDWPPLIEFLKHRTIPAQGRNFVFITPDPGVNDRCHWLRVSQQQQWGVPTRVEAAAAAEGVTLKTRNARRLEIDLAALTAGQNPLIPPDGDPASTVLVRIDDSELHLPRQAVVHLRRDQSDAWTVAPPDPAEKHPAGTGPFKNAYRNHMLFVIGDDQWSLAKARYDAETFWYRGNGSIDIIRAADLTPQAAAGRNIIAYGSNAFNSVRQTLGLPDLPVAIDDATVRIGDRSISREDLAVLAVMPRPSEDALLAVVAGTGPAGDRLCEQAPVFVSGIGYPDWTILASDMLNTGFDGVVGTGFFDEQWRYDPNQAAWGDDQ